MMNVASGADRVTPMRIDAHQHFWQIGRNGQSWPMADLPAIYRDFLPDDLAPELVASGFDGTVLVQSQPDDADTDWLLDLAGRTSWVAGVVGWADLLSTDAPARIAALASRPKLRGLRPMIQDMPDTWILDPALAPALEAMIGHRLVFDALIRPRHLDAVARFAAAHPRLAIVVDHAAKPDIARQQRQGWADQIAALALNANVSCKISGMLTEANRHWTPGDFDFYIRHLLSCFGADRLIWGSDWPVIRLAGDYAAWLQVCATAFSDLSEADRSAIFGGNAARIYGLTLSVGDSVEQSDR